MVTVSPDALVHLAGIAEDAGRAILARYGQAGPVAWKGAEGPVTDADRAAHEVILAALASWDPGTPVISEEGEIPSSEERRSWRRFWLVDPLDGTKEFLSRNGEFTVNIALIRDGVPVLGVVHAPALGLTYSAGEGLGSWKRVGAETPVRLESRAAEPGIPLRVAESRSHPSAELEAYLASVSVSERIPMGSSLKFCLLAEGRADLYPRLGPTREWDVAAGDCIFRYSAAVGRRASPLRYNGPDLLVPRFVLGEPEVESATAAAHGQVLWFTGLSGAGKSTIAREVVAVLAGEGRAVESLDGDVLRTMWPGTGFTRVERDAHIRRVAWLASRLAHHGVTVVVSLVSPYVESRSFARSLCARFLEIYVATPIDECERRDPKGLYARARRGEVAHFTGIDDPYEPPAAPEVWLDTSELSVSQAVERVLEATRGLHPEGVAP